MENVHSALQRYDLPIKRASAFWLVLLVGAGLGAVLGGLAGLNPLLGVAGDLLLLLAIIVVPRPIFVVYGLTFLLPLTAGMDRGGVIPFLRVGQALLVVGFLFFLLARPGRQGKSRLTSIDLAFLLFFLAGDVFPVLALLYRGETLSLNTPDRFTGVTPIQVLLGPLQYYLLYRIVVAIISSERQIVWVLKLSFITSMIVSVIGILQKLGVGVVTTFLATYYPTTNLHEVFSLQPLSLTDLRITSTLESYSGLAAYLACNVIAALACYSASRKPIISPLLLAATLFINSAALVLTGTFVAWFGVAIGAVTVFIVFRRVPRSLVFVVVGMVLTALIFAPFLASRFSDWLVGANSQAFVPQTYAYRIVLWQDLVLPAIGQHPLFGAGPAPKSSAYWPSEETQYLSLLLRGGLLYLLSYVLLMGVAIAACWKQIKRKSGGASYIVAAATLAILVAINAMNVSGEYFTYAGVTQILWTFLAMVVASTQLSLADQGRRNSNGCSVSAR